MLLRQGAQQLLSNIQKVIMMKSEIRIRNSAEICHVDIEGDIGVPEEWQFEEPGQRVATYERFRAAAARIAALEAAEVVVSIRSTGGDVNDALLIYDALRALPGRVTTRCYGYTASAATLIAQAASEGRREIAAGALYLIHNSECSVEGNVAELTSRIELLRKTDERLAEIYAARSGRPAAEFAALMAENNGAGRWLSPEEAVAAGLADRVIGAEAPEPDAGGDAAAAGGDAETEELYGFDDGAEESSAERPSACGASDAAPGSLARWVHRAVRGWRERLSGGRGGMRRETAEELSGREPAAAAQSGGTTSDALRRGDDARPLPADAADAVVVQRRSVLALREAQLQVGPTRVRPTEDPSCRERLRTANERAYAEDARSFAKN